MDNLKFKIRYCLEATGDMNEKGEPIRMEALNDSKYLLGIFSAIDTSKDPFKSRRRTILRLYRTIFDVSKKWANRIQCDMMVEEDVSVEEEISVSPEAMEFLKELVDKPPEGVQYRTIPLQELLVSIEDQYDAWKRGSAVEDGESKNTEEAEVSP